MLRLKTYIRYLGLLLVYYYIGIDFEEVVISEDHTCRQGKNGALVGFHWNPGPATVPFKRGCIW